MRLRLYFPAILLAAIAVAPSGATAAPTYVVNTLGSLGPYSSYSSVTGMNSFGQVVGINVSDEGGFRAFSSSGGVMTDLHPAGAHYSAAFGINDAGVVVGSLNSGRGAIFSGGGVTPFGSIAWSEARSINNSGTITGITLWNNGVDGAYRSTPANGMAYLGTLGGGYSKGYAINQAGTVVGVAHSRTATHAFSEYGGVMHDLGALGQDSLSVARAVNDSGVAVGWATDPASGYLQFAHAVVFSGTELIDLNPAGWAQSAARGINNHGEIVGTLGDHSPNHDGFEFETGGSGFLYSGGVMMDINSLIDPNSGWILSGAIAINDNHQIAAQGYDRDGNYQGVLLTLWTGVSPVPEPETWGMLLFGLGLVGLTARRKAAGAAARNGQG